MNEDPERTDPPLFSRAFHDRQVQSSLPALCRKFAFSDQHEFARS